MSTWHWVQEVLVPGLFQDGKQQQQNASGPYVGDGEAVLVGMPRFRQLRVKKGFRLSLLLNLNDES